MSTDKIVIGNVNFYKNDVKSSSVTYRNGEKIHCVFLKDGTKLQFKDQDARSGASVIMGRYEGDKRSKEGVGFSNIKGLSIEGTEKNDFYHLMNCENYNVDTEGGGKDEVRIVNGLGKPKNHGMVNADNTDKIDFDDCSKAMSMSEGFFSRSCDPPIAF